LGCDRDTAKPFLYAFLFGGGVGKLGSILTGTPNAKVGKDALDKFQNSIPGMKQLKEKLKNEYERTALAFGKDKAFIRGIDGRIVFASSEHQLLNYLLQTLEGVTCKAAAVYLKRKLVERNIPHYFVIHYHDEVAVVTKDEYAVEVSELAVEAFTEAPKWFGVTCMSGEAKEGKNYADVH
jgi:DNA polymerase-1